MKNILLTTTLALALAAVLTPDSRAHCEIPCGIYDDAMRVEMILEHCTTIEKAMAKISGGEENQNQAVRWITNKESHATEIQHIVTQYFMTQRVKPGAEGTPEKLQLLHGMLVEAMKCKQTTDPQHVAKLRDLVEKFKVVYFGPAAAADPHAGHSH